MKKMRLAVCIGDEEYRDRLMGCLMKHYKEQLELHVFESWEQMERADESFDLRLLGDCEQAFVEDGRNREFSLYLCEQGIEHVPEEKEGMYFAEKYQEVNKLAELMFSYLPEEIHPVERVDRISGRTKVVAVYSLSENEYQLPFGVTLGSILGEQGRVLLVDMQENSGFSQVIGETKELGLEEILVMAESGTYSKKRIASCIGHGNGIDYVYPVENSECLCEVEGSTYLRMIVLLQADLGYDTVILNLGSRFPGFTDLLRHCDSLYFLHRLGGLCQWREQEFLEELRCRGGEDVTDRMIRVEIPAIQYPAVSFERLVEQWKWNEMGDLIRRMVPQVASHG